MFYCKGHPFWVAGKKHNALHLSPKFMEKKQNKIYKKNFLQSGYSNMDFEDFVKIVLSFISQLTYLVSLSRSPTCIWDATESTLRYNTYIT